MKRSDLPYFAKTTKNGVDCFLIGGSARATYIRSEVKSCEDVRTGEVVPMLVMMVPLSQFQTVDWDVLLQIAADEASLAGN